MKKADYQLMDIDTMMDEQFGKVGSPQREAFRQEAYNYCVGQMLHNARKEAKLTQTALAQQIGTNKSYISRIENGSIEPGVGVFLRILNALGLKFEISRPIPLAMG